MINNLFKTQKIIFLFVVVVLVLFISKTVFAVWSGTFYEPGDTLNPECLPTQTDCDVRSPLTSINISDTAYDATTWDGVTTIAPSKNAIRDKLENLGAITPTTINGLTITANGTNTLNIAAGKTLTSSNTLTLAGTDSSTLNIGTGGTLGSNAFTSTAYAPLASPTFTTNITTPLIIGGTSTTSDLNLKTTSGIGATGADMHFLVGNNGATEAMTILNSGNVGIGTTNPAWPLHVVAGDAPLVTETDSFNGPIFWGSSAYQGLRFQVSDSDAVPYIAFDTGVVDTPDSSSLNQKAYIAYWGDTAGYLALGYSGSTDVLNIKTNGPNAGNVGIGMTAPLLKLDVDGSARFSGTATSELTGDIDPAASTTVTGTNGTLFLTELVVGDRITVTGETRTVTAIASDTSLTVNAAFTDNAPDVAPDKLAAIFVARNSSGAVKLVLNDLGSVGINTTAPGRKLDVLDVDDAAQLRLSRTAAIYSELYTDSAGELRISSTGADVRLNEENLWVCAGGSCSTLVTTTSPPAENGNLIVETSIILDNGFRLKQTGVTTVDMLDSGTNIILQFDEAS